MFTESQALRCGANGNAEVATAHLNLDALAIGEGEVVTHDPLGADCFEKLDECVDATNF